MASQLEGQADRVPRKHTDKFAERRAELGEAALQTLATLGYARTSMREIAQNSVFSHGVLHYYFTDKVDLIVCSVGQYKARCVARYDVAAADAATYGEMMDGFLRALGDTLRDEAHMHRLWYDLRAQALFEEAFRADIAAIEESLENMVMRTMKRLSELAEAPVVLAPSVLYALIDGLFQRSLLRHLSGEEGAVESLRADARTAIDALFRVAAHAA